jgi:hypothetical protein
MFNDFGRAPRRADCLLFGNEGSFRTLYLLSPSEFDPSFRPPVRSNLR